MLRGYHVVDFRGNVPPRYITYMVLDFEKGVEKEGDKYALHLLKRKGIITEDELSEEDSFILSFFDKDKHICRVYVDKILSENLEDLEPMFEFVADGREAEW